MQNRTNNTLKEEATLRTSNVNHDCFAGITGDVNIDGNGDRIADYSLLDMNPETSMFEVSLNYTCPYVCTSLACSPSTHHQESPIISFKALRFRVNGYLCREIDKRRTIDLKSRAFTTGFVKQSGRNVKVLQRETTMPGMFVKLWEGICFLKWDVSIRSFSNFYTRLKYVKLTKIYCFYGFYKNFD